MATKPAQSKKPKPTPRNVKIALGKLVKKIESKAPAKRRQGTPATAQADAQSDAGERSWLADAKKREAAKKPTAGAKATPPPKAKARKINVSLVASADNGFDLAKVIRALLPLIEKGTTAAQETFSMGEASYVIK